jgi:ribosomal subunit interface protein
MKNFQVRVSGKQIEIGTSLPEHVQAKLQEILSKYFDRGIKANVVFSHDGPFYRADCVIHLDSGVMLKAHGEGADIHRSFAAALDHVEKQARRYKRKLKNHHDKARASEGVGA